MRALISIAIVGALVTVAQAQPGSQPYPPPPPYAQQPPMQAQLTLDEQYLLERGYITQSQHVGGGIVSLFFGFGIGQAIQGRWSETGWIFTLGEAATGTLFVYGMVDLLGNCFEGCSEQRERRGVTLMLGGLLGMAAFRVWEIVDAFTGPPAHNRRLHHLHMRLGLPVPMYTRLSPYIAPPRDGDGAVAGLSLRF